MKFHVMINVSMPFLGSNLKQAVEFSDLQGFEATIFNRQDLETENWLDIWKNIKLLRNQNPSIPITFHFPVNNCNYSDNQFVKNRVIESLDRANDLNLSGVVVHSNRIRLISDWDSINLDEERLIVCSTLADIRSHTSGKTPWLSLENMPVMDNYGKEIDPLFCFPSDFNIIQNLDVGIVWDICHYTNSLTNMNEVFNGQQRCIHYPNIQNCKVLDFLSLEPQIKHWHFSAFSGVADPDQKTFCREGVVPTESELGEELYGKILKEISALDNNHRLMVIEIQEQNYTIRKNFAKTVKWIRENEYKIL